MAAQRVAAKQDDIERQHERAHTDAEGNSSCCWIFEPKSLVNIEREKHEKKQGQVEEIAMRVLQDQRKIALPPVAFARLADRTGRRIGPERLVVRPTVVVAGEAEAARSPKDQNGRREEEPAWPPCRFRPEPAMLRSAK